MFMSSAMSERTSYFCRLLCQHPSYVVLPRLSRTVISGQAPNMAQCAPGQPWREFSKIGHITKINSLCQVPVYGPSTQKVQWTEYFGTTEAGLRSQDVSRKRPRNFVLINESVRRNGACGRKADAVIYWHATIIGTRRNSWRRSKPQGSAVCIVVEARFRL